MVDKFQEKSQLSEIVKDRPKIPATKLGCSVSSSNSQGEPLQEQKQNGDSWDERKHKQQQKPNSGGQVKPSHQVQDQQLNI